MPFRFTEACELSNIRLLGTVTSQDLAELSEEWVRRAGATPESPSRIIDLAGVDSFEVNPHALTALAIRRRESPDKAVVRAAIIRSENLDFEISGFTQTNAEGRLIEMKIVNSYDEALSWLGQAKGNPTGRGLVSDLRSTTECLPVG